MSPAQSSSLLVSAATAIDSSAKEFAKRAHEIYKPAPPVEESPAMIQEKLLEFHRELEKISAAKKQCLIQAQEKCPELLTDEFILMFLRSMRFLTDLAARRFVQYWQERVKIFGPVKAFEPLTLDRALSEDTQALQLCYFCLMPDGVRDERNKSRLVVHDPSCLDVRNCSRESLYRAVWYMVHAGIVQDEAAQRFGTTILVNLGNFRVLQHLDTRLARMVLKGVQGTLPVRVAAIHVVNTPRVYAALARVVRSLLPAFCKQRIHIHTGAQDKFVPQLAGHGISQKALPEFLGGTVVLDHAAWLENRRRQGL